MENLRRAIEFFLRSSVVDHQVYLRFFIGGAIGALVHMLVCDNKLILPRAISGALVLGFIGPMVVGGFVGAVADGSLVAASLAGYTGSSVLEKFLPGIKIDQLNENDLEKNDDKSV